MDRLLIVVLLGWMAVAQVSAGLTFASDNQMVVAEEIMAEQSKRIDFEALNAFLVANSSLSDDPKANLAFLESSLDQLEPPVKAAAQLLLDLVNKSSIWCSNELMQILLQLRVANLKTTGHKRVEKLMGRSWDKTIGGCTFYLFIKQRGLGNKARFMQQFKESHKWFTPLEAKNLFMTLENLAKRSAKKEFLIQEYSELSGKKTIRKDRARFDEAFNQLMVRPCKAIVSDDSVLETMVDIASVRFHYGTKVGPVYHDTRSELDIESDLKFLVWLRYACPKIINMGEPERALVFNSVQVPAN